MTQNNVTGIARVWAKILAISAALGVFLALVGQIQQVSDIVKKVNVTAVEWIWSQLLTLDSMRFSVATSVASDYQQNAICVVDVTTPDLGREGKTTDLLVQYVDPLKLNIDDQHYTCDEIRKNAFEIEGRIKKTLMFARFTGWGYDAIKPVAFTLPVAISTESSLIIATYVQTDFPASTIYGYQNGEIAEIGSYNHMIEIGTGDDEEVEIFNVIPQQNGIEIRSAEGLSQILWDQGTGKYKASGLQWQALINDGQTVLFVDKTDPQNPVLMLNEAAIETDNSDDVAITMDSLERMVFDPYCRPEKGFKPVKNTLGAVVFDLSAHEHIFMCSLLTHDIRVRLSPG